MTKQVFPTGDFDPAFPLDTKFLDLAARYPRLYYSAVGIYWTVVAATWRDASRRPVGRVAPGARAEAVAALTDAGLLDEEGCIPSSSFENWVGQAVTRRTDWRDRQRSSRARHVDVTPMSTNVPARAHADQTRSDQITDQTGGAGGSGYPTPGADRDSLDTYHELTGFRPWGVWSGDALKGAIAEYGDAEVETALREEHAAGAGRDDLMKRSLARLAKEADRARSERVTKPKPVKPPFDQKLHNETVLRLMKGETA